MARKVLTPKGDGKPIGLYSAGYAVDPGQLVFVAGQVAMDANGQVVGAGDLVAQAGQVFRNVEAVLKEAGCSFRDVVKFTTFLTRHEHFTPFTEWRQSQYPRLFPDGAYPPNTGVVVQSLARPELLLEVEAIAVKSGRPAASARPTRRPAKHGAKRPAQRAARRRR